MSMPCTWKRAAIAWKFKASGSVNTAVTVDEGRIYFGANGGSVYCLNEADGKLEWEFKVQKSRGGSTKTFYYPCFT